MGLMHVETVQIQAEAYDVAMDISFPRGEEDPCVAPAHRTWFVSLLYCVLLRDGQGAGLPVHPSG